jgi:hypothetical protein
MTTRDATRDQALTQTMSKRCSYWQQTQPLTAFAISRSNSTGFPSHCKECDAQLHPHRHTPNKNLNQMTQTIAIQLNNSHTITHTNRRPRSIPRNYSTHTVTPRDGGLGRGGGVVRHRGNPQVGDPISPLPDLSPVD